MLGKTKLAQPTGHCPQQQSGEACLAATVDAPSVYSDSVAGLTLILVLVQGVFSVVCPLARVHLAVRKLEQ
jgi:hypothetical protein